MLIQRARPRLRPPGNVVFRLNRSHRLAGEARAVVVFGPPFGLARDLVTGALFRQQTGFTFPGATDDGMGLNAGNGTTFNTIETAEVIPLWAIYDEITVAWRGFVGNTGGGGGVLAAGNNAASNCPWLFALGGNFASHTLFRAGPTGFRRWTGATPGTTQFIDFDATITKSVSQGANIAVAPLFYTRGVAAGSASSLDGTGSGPSSGGPFRLTSAFDFGNAWHTSNIAIAAARVWTADEHLAFHLDPYGVLEEAPRWYFANTGAVGPLSAEIAGTVDITASVAAALALDATIAGTVDVTASVAATTALDAEIAGAVPITASIAARLDRLAEIAGTIPITASITAFIEGGAGDTHDGFLRRSRRQRALEAAERRRDAERLADARALRLELEAALGMAADAVEEAPAPAVEAVREAVAVVRALPPVAPAIDFAAARAAVSDLLAAIEAARRAKELADDDEDVEILLRAL